MKRKMNFMCYTLTSKKAFDSVAHDLLLQKIEKLDNGGNFHTIVASYLSDRQQNVKVYYCNSEIVPVNSGAVQLKVPYTARYFL